jgi:hypothetical protein
MIFNDSIKFIKKWFKKNETKSFECTLSLNIITITILLKKYYKFYTLHNYLLKHYLKLYLNSKNNKC